MASADDSIPACERAKWATYPILAVQGWAQHHNVKLRAVVATEDQFKNFDPGAAKITLQPDDIPDCCRPLRPTSIHRLTRRARCGSTSPSR